ncbi:MAG: hypothetical protein II998_00140 [Clostridia bacterium]|nr:hypothetical protein [Clostridia bacterium]
MAQTKNMPKNVRPQMAIIMAENIAVLAGYDVNIESDTVAWVKKHRKAWLEQNKESELGEIEKVFLTINKKTKGDY